MLNHLLDNSVEFKKIMQAIQGKRFPLNITGTADAQKAHLISCLCERAETAGFVITYNETAAKRLCEDLSYFIDGECVYIPPMEVLLYDVEASDRKSNNNRAAAVAKLAEGAMGIASIESFLHFVVQKNEYASMKYTIVDGGSINSNEFAERLTQMGYIRCDIIDAPGQFAIRGGILDVFSPGIIAPVRIELFGDDIDSMRYFDPETQLSTERIDKAEIIPLKNPNLEGSLFSYIEENAFLFFDEPQRISEAAKVVEWELDENIRTLSERDVKIREGKLMNSFAEIISEAEKRCLIGLNSISKACPDYKCAAQLNITAKGMGSYSGNIEFFTEDVRQWLSEKRLVMLLGGSSSRIVKLREMLNEHSIAASAVKNEDEFSVSYVNILTGSIEKGFEYPLEKIVVISDREIFSAEKKVRRMKHDENSMRIKNTDQLEIGDLVVHKTHGIGKYLGIVRMKVEGISKDYIKIEYRGEDFLYLPVGQLDNVGKYTGGGESRSVRLNKLGSNEWASAKRKVRHSVEEMASRLVSLYAERERAEGIAFSPDTPWQHKFEDQFPYEETEDQLRSTEEIKKDMESNRPMDRLLCGDVGYGKTEVAMRGAFKAVMDGYQVAYLVPTTILASQHYNNFKERMKEFPVTVRLLSRFSTPSETKRTLAMLKSGECDIVVGTHKLLSQKVIFKKLGFLIVDEEQRFGVTHKEKIKEMKKNVDVLTLSATPIPRTLHMAMIGIRDMSVLGAPPSDRYPVQTYVLEYNEAIIQNAITREIARNGQVYYLYNRVESIYKVAERLSTLVPEAKIGVAHGRMSETELENIMMQVDSGEIDVLVCTTIIETGLDIPNVNTIIIENADNLGLSQLYQLRGRVGRTNRLAYAYLTYRKNKMLDETAEKRLRAIKEFTEFGSGFRIALRDLEIRGAGNVLGPEQHGFMASVGYDTYCSILAEAVNSAMGKPTEPEKIETSVDINVNAFIPDSYIPTSALRIEAYKKIAGIENQRERYLVEEEFEDRYGDIPSETFALMDIQMIKCRAQKLGIYEITHVEAGIVFRLSNPDKETVSKVAGLATKFRGKILFGAGEKPYILLREKNLKSEKLLHTVSDVISELES